MIRCWPALVLGLLVAGCGTTPSTTPALDHLPGARVAEMAERQLEAAHPSMAPGTMRCPDLDWKVGATVRCSQTAELGGGRMLTILGTVRVTDVRGGGRMHVRLDDQVHSYGLTGRYLTAELTARAARRLGAVPDPVRCPSLVGPVGTAVRCTVGYRGRTGTVLARVTGRVPERYATSYVFDWHRFRLG